MARHPSKSLASRPERLFRVFSRLAAMTRDLKHLATGQEIDSTLMESFGVLQADAPDRPSDAELLWLIPANDKAIEQSHFVNRAIDIMYFTVDIMELQIALLQRPDAEVSDDIKRIIRRSIREDGDKFTELQRKINEVLEAQNLDTTPLKENQLDRQEISEVLTNAQNAFLAIFDARYVIPPEGEEEDKNFSYVPLKSKVRRGSISSTLEKIFDARLHLLDLSIDILEFKMHATLRDMARFAQWKVLKEANPHLQNPVVAREMQKSLEDSHALRPALQAGVSKMYAYFSEIVDRHTSTGEFKPILNRFVVAPASDLPQITP